MAYKMKNYFKIIVLTAMTSYVAYFCLPFFEVYLYRPEVLELLTWNTYDATINSGGAIPYIWLGAYGIVSIGLIYFQAWAKTSFLALTALSLFLAFFSGLTVMPNYEGALSSITTLCDGAILALAYLSSIKNEFR